MTRITEIERDGKKMLIENPGEQLRTGDHVNFRGTRMLYIEAAILVEEREDGKTTRAMEKEKIYIGPENNLQTLPSQYFIKK